MAILWNVSKKQSIEAKYDGDAFTFKPDEKKKVYIPDIIRHLVYKLGHKGLVVVPDELNDDKELKALYLAGLQRRKAMLKDVIVQYQTMNNERKAANLGQIEPSQYEVECVREIKEIDKEINEVAGISKEDAQLVKDYLNEGMANEKEAEKVMTRIKTDRTGESVVSDDEEEIQEEAQEEAQSPKRKGRPRAVNVD